MEEMLGRLRLTGIMEQDGQLVAYVDISGDAPERPSRYGRPSAATPTTSRVERVAKGDHVLDFEVVEITRESVKLQVAGFEATLSF